MSAPSNSRDPRFCPIPDFSTNRSWVSLSGDGLDSHSRVVEVPRDTPFPHFTLSTQNVLADRYVSSETYDFVSDPLLHLDKHRRTRLLAQHLDFLRSDVVCLQELQGDQLQYLLGDLGFGESYDSHYKKITKRKIWISDPEVHDDSRAEYEAKELRLDGVGILWRKDKFRLVGEPIDIDFNAVAYAEATQLFGVVGDFEDPYLQERENPMSIFLSKTCLSNHNVATMCVLEKINESCEDESLQVLVATIHGFHGKKHWMQQIYQYEILCRRISEVAEAAGVSRIVVCGDFNMQPGSNSLGFIEKGNAEEALDEALAQADPPCLRIRSKKLLWFDLVNKRRPKHSLHLRQAYPPDDKEFTHFCAKKADRHVTTLDYIFHSCETLTALSVYRIVSDSVETPFPNDDLECSDHLLLSAEFRFQSEEKE